MKKKFIIKQSDIVQCIIILGVIVIIELLTHNITYGIIWLLISELALGTKDTYLYHKKIKGDDGEILVTKKGLIVHICFIIILLIMLFCNYSRNLL